MPRPASKGSLPVYLQISERLIREIGAGRLPDGARLPPEREMAASFSISVGTLRKALAELFDVDTTMEAVRIEQPGNGALDQTQLLQNVMERLKRREIYRHMSNSADRLARAGNTLHDIVVKIA